MSFFSNISYLNLYIALGFLATNVFGIDNSKMIIYNVNNKKTIIRTGFIIYFSKIIYNFSNRFLMIVFKCFKGGK